MKKFQFRLETVLKVRKIEMEEQAKALALARLDLDEAERELEGIHQLQRDEVDRVKQLSENGLFLEQMMQVSIGYRDELVRKRERKRREIKTLQVRVENEQRSLIEKEKRRKVLERLKEKDKEAYEIEIRKTEIKQMDDIASSRHRLRPHS